MKRKTLVANGVVQKEVCVQWDQFVSRLEVPGGQWAVKEFYLNDTRRF
jgi:hypothetical protein